MFDKFLFSNENGFFGNVGIFRVFWALCKWSDLWSNQIINFTELKSTKQFKLKKRNVDMFLHD